VTSSLKSTVATKAEFVYVTYIQATAEEAWKALTQGDITRQYWGYENRSDWKRGSNWEHRKAGEDKAVLVGKVEEVNPPKRLVLTWAEPKDAGDPAKVSRGVSSQKREQGTGNGKSSSKGPHSRFS
jgi:uncharacterized protein YndB with AHSA1/START domain